MPDVDLVVVPEVKLSIDELDAFRENWKADPAIAKLYSLQREYVQSRGGPVLEVWQRFDGRIFGKPCMCDLETAALRARIPLADAQELHDQVMADVLPRWKASPEYAGSPYEAMHARQAQGLPPYPAGH